LALAIINTINRNNGNIYISFTSILLYHTVELV